MAEVSVMGLLGVLSSLGLLWKVSAVGMCYFLGLFYINVNVHELVLI